MFKKKGFWIVIFILIVLGVSFYVWKYGVTIKGVTIGGPNRQIK